MTLHFHNNIYISTVTGNSTCTVRVPAQALGEQREYLCASRRAQLPGGAAGDEGGRTEARARHARVWTGDSHDGHRRDGPRDTPHQQGAV